MAAAEDRALAVADATSSQEDACALLPSGQDAQQLCKAIPKRVLGAGKVTAAPAQGRSAGRASSTHPHGATEPSPEAPNLALC